MSLPAVDENWYCEDCDLNFEYCDKPDFLFCPNCGKVLKNDMYQYKLDGLTLPEKLTYDEAYSIYELNGWGNLVRIEEFISKLSQDILESDQFKPNEKINYIENERFNRILKLREDLYVKLMIIESGIKY
ncbi:hypothetical protein [Methanobrevibacter smithii]|uniref:hypothetical protein n=1 Tax=Methanobrevibacter smithii TaxID=2173 RepID=UPI0037DD1EA8